MAGRIPATIVTGFLGSGKTSLIRHLLAEAKGRRLALVINEFGSLGIDREILLGCGIESCREEDVLELANGCICCTVADDFLPTMRQLLDRPSPPDHIVIETSGLAIPKPLLKAFGWPDVRTRVTVDGVIAVVDAETALAQLRAEAARPAASTEVDHESPVEELLEEQLACADLILVNKQDRVVDATERAAIDAYIHAHARPTVHRRWTSHGQIDPIVALGLACAAEDDLGSRHSHTDAEGEHDHEDFSSFVVDLGEMPDPAVLEPRIRAVAKAHEVYRVKGFIAVPGKPMRQVVQAVGERVERYFDRPWSQSEPRSSRLVVIGARDLDRPAIERILRDA